MQREMTERVWSDLEGAAVGDPLRRLRIILATDGSDTAVAATEMLAGLPLPPGTAIRVLTVITPPGFGKPHWLDEALKEWAGRVESAARERLEAPGREVTAETRIGNEDASILKAAEDYAADLIVLGHRGLTGLDNLLLGSVARNIAKHADCSVLLGRPVLNGLRSILLAVDDSEHSQLAVDFAAHLPLPEDAVIHVSHVCRPEAPILGFLVINDPDWRESFQEENRRLMEESQSLVAGVSHRLRNFRKNAQPEVLTGDPASQILEHAREVGADLIICGARGTSLIERLRTGSVADRLLRDAPCSVAIIR